MTSIILPFPPSMHGIFRKHNGKNLSEDYRKWRDLAGWELLGQKPKKVKGPVSVLIELYPPDKRSRDADNYIKAPLDLLVAHQIIEADDSRFLRSITASWVDVGVIGKGKIQVTVKEE